MGMPGLTEILLIFGVVVLLFGGKKLPELGGAIGEAIKNFKKGVRDSDPKVVSGTKEETKTIASEQSTDKKSDS